MIDLFNTPVYYISFKRKESIEKEFKELGFNIVRHFKAVDGRKFNPYQLYKDNMISARAYDDLTYKRSSHNGIPSLGAIGCSLSHYHIWKKCIENNYPYIIAVEDDVKKMKEKISNEDLDKINEIFKKPNTVYLSVPNTNLRGKVFGTHFVMLDLEACKNLVNGFFPIEEQVDMYMNSRKWKGDINLENFEMFNQGNSRGTSIQDACLKCSMPDDKNYYIIIGTVTSIIIFFLIIYVIKFKFKIQ